MYAIFENDRPVSAFGRFDTVDAAVEFFTSRGGYAEVDADHPGYADAFWHGITYTIGEVQTEGLVGNYF